LTTYRPNATVGAVLETLTTAARPTPLAPDASTLATNVVEKRPKGALPAVVEKIEYWTHEGRKTLYLVVSFLTLEAGAQRVERAIEFFMPVGQSGESQQWITASMRLLSLAARGGFLARALEDMRKVAWDRGPVRLGTHTRADGTEVPLWHDSEVAAVAHAIQHILMRRSTPTADTAGCAVPSAAPAVGRQEAARTVDGWRGRKCPECGAHALMRKDGCDGCSACGYVGACG
jgi:ribonucleoside-diphosphate reductase alpha chain